MERKKGSSRVDTEITGLAGEKKIIPVMEEELQVGKRTVTTGLTRIRKVIREREEVVDEPLLQEELVVERVPVNRFVDTPVPIRQKGTVTIIPLFEEVMVVEKRLLFKEELHVSKKRHTVRKPQNVTLKSEEAIIEHPEVPDEQKH